MFFSIFPKIVDEKLLFKVGLTFFYGENEKGSLSEAGHRHLYKNNTKKIKKKPLCKSSHLYSDYDP